MQQNYQLDNSYVYYAVPFTAIQSLLNANVVNATPLVILTTLLPSINSQVLNFVDTCGLPKGITPRTVEIELTSNNTKYKFDIPFNSSSPSWLVMLNELDVLAIKSHVITGETIKSYKVKSLLTKVP